MSKYWFKPKTYGWGFVPVTWEGWMATLVLIGFILLALLSNGFYSEEGPTVKEALQLILDLAFITVIATMIFDRKTEEELRWRWGRRK